MLPTARESPAGMRWCDKLVVAGGYPAESLYGTNLVEVFTTAWVEGPEMLSPRGELAFGWMGGSLILAGGWGPLGHTGDTEKWDLTSQAWKAIPSMPTPRAGACGAVIGGRFYVVGGGQYTGMQAPWKSLSTVEVLSTD